MGKKKILVTGAAGFIGSNLCEKLLAQGHSVIGLDNFSTGYEKNIAHLLPLSSFELIKHDITNSFIADVGQIYNLACPSSQVSHISSPIETIRTVILGTMNMLKLADRCEARILQASTSKVYGNTHTSSIAETTPGMVNMQSKSAAYIESKRVAETIMTSFLNKHGTDIRIARIFNTYGPNMWQDDNRIISMVIERALLGRNITIYNNALQYRSPCYVDDVVDGLICLMNDHQEPCKIKYPVDYSIGVTDGCSRLSNRPSEDVFSIHRSSHNEWLHRPINIGNPDRMTIKDLTEKIIAMTGSKSKIKYMNLSDNNVGHCTPDISRAKELLDWQPKVGLEVGLARTIRYFENKLSGISQGFPCNSWVEMA